MIGTSVSVNGTMQSSVPIWHNFHSGCLVACCICGHIPIASATLLIFCNGAIMLPQHLQAS